MSRQKSGVIQGINVPEERVPYYWHTRKDSKAYWSIIVPSSEDATNFVRNPSFERNLDGWGGDGLANTSMAFGDAFCGGYALLAEPIAAGVTYSATYASLQSFASPFGGLQIVIGSTIYGCVHVKSGIGDLVSVSFVQDGFTTPGVGAVDGPKTQLVGNGDWQQFCFSYFSVDTDPPGLVPARAVRILIENNNASGSDAMLIDCAIVTVDQEAAYFDGDTPGASWTGPQFDDNPGNATSHASISEVSRFASTYGEKVNFIDLGLDMNSDAGWGIAPTNTIATSVARGSGSHVQRQRSGARTITLTGTIGDAPCEIHQKRQELINALTYRFSKLCLGESLLCYSLTNWCGERITYELQIPVLYDSGLEGSRTDLTLDRVSVNFLAARQTYFCERNEISIRLIPQGSVDIEYLGNHEASVIVEFRAGSQAMQVESIVNETTGIPINFGVPNPPLTINAGEYVILDTTEGNVNMTLHPGVDGGGDQISGLINYPTSQVGSFCLVRGINKISVEANLISFDSEIIMRYQNCYRSIDGVRLLPGKECC